MEEIPIPQNKGEEFVSSTISDPVKMDLLIFSDQSLSNEIKDQLSDFTEDELRDTLSSTLRGIGHDDDDNWGQDQRDAALGLLSLIPLDKLNKNRIINTYVSSIGNLGEDSDIFGSCLSIAEAGKILAPYFPPNLESIHKLRNAWNSFYFRSKQDAGDIDQLRKAEAEIRTNMPQELGNELGGRKNPEMEPKFEELHQRYLEITDKDGSFKIDLWRNTEDFRKMCANFGISLDKYWNISDPGQIESAIKILSETKPEGFERFVNNVLQKTGIDIRLAPSDEIRAVSDEIRNAADITISELKGSIRSFPETLQRIKGVAEKASTSNLPKKTLAPVIQFLERNGVEPEQIPSKAGEISDMLDDPLVIRLLEEKFNQSQNERLSFINLLGVSLKLDEGAKNFRLASRTKDDLFLGDKTGDCTSYHLNVGFNAWTLPEWLANPGFNFFLIENGDGELVSKLGIYLATAAEKPVLLIDSIEIGKSQNENEVKELISNGLGFLKQWADNIGLQGVYANGISNTPYVSDLLDGMSSPEKNKYMLLGELKGIEEYRMKTLNSSVGETNYLQSSIDNGDMEDYSGYRIETSIGILEKYIQDTIKKLSKKDKDNFTNAGKSHDWKTVYSTITQTLFPNLMKEIPEEYGDYRDLKKIHIVDWKEGPGFTYEISEQHFYEKIIEKRTTEIDRQIKEIEKRIKSLEDRKFDEDIDITIQGATKDKLREEIDAQNRFIYDDDDWSEEQESDWRTEEDFEIEDLEEKRDELDQMMREGYPQIESELSDAGPFIDHIVSLIEDRELKEEKILQLLFGGTGDNLQTTPENETSQTIELTERLLRLS